MFLALGLDELKTYAPPKTTKEHGGGPRGKVVQAQIAAPSRRRRVRYQVVENARRSGYHEHARRVEEH